MMLRSTVVGVVSIFLLIPRVSSNHLDHDPIKQFCRRFYHQAAQIGNRLYIDGGYVTTNLNNEHNANFTNDRLLFHNLDDDSKNIAPLTNNLTKPSSVPSVVGGALWADQVNEKLYLFGGEFPDTSPSDNNVWSYDPWDDSWEKMESEGSIDHPSFGAMATVEHLGVGYYLGGWLGPMNHAEWDGPRRAQNFMLAYDMVGNSFTKITGPNREPRVEGVMVYVPAGDQGLLVSFGGMYAVNGSEENLIPAPMEDIDIFNIDSQRWTTVTATGDKDGIPGSRRLFCGGLSSAEDGSSHNTYIYGGASTSKDEPGQDDVWILTMPTFKWIRYWKNDTPSYHNGFTCNILKAGQMAVIGGTFPHSETDCDAPSAQGSHYMDLGRANEDDAIWYGYRKNLDSYSVPKDIISEIGGNPDGSAALSTPSGGFKDGALTTLFSRQVIIKEPRAPTRKPAASTPTATNTPDDYSGPTNVGVIVGPSVGLGVPAVAAMLGFYLYRRRSQKKSLKAHSRNFHDLNIPDSVYQLPTTQSPLQTPTGRLFHYPVNAIYPSADGKYPPAASNTAKHTMYPPYIYQPPYQANEKGAFEPQELPAARVSVAPGASSVGRSVSGPPQLPAKDDSYDSTLSEKGEQAELDDVERARRSGESRNSRRDSSVERLWKDVGGRGPGMF